MSTAYFMGPLERVLHFRTVGTFEGLGAPMLAAVAQHSRERFFPKGTTIADAGQPWSTIQFVIDGRLQVTRSRTPNTAATAGAVVGLVERLARSVPDVGAVAIEDTRTLEIEWDTMLDLWEQHFPIVQACLRHLARGVRDSLGIDPDGRRLGTGTPYAKTGNLLLPDRVQALLSVGSFRDDHPDGLVELARQAAPLDVIPGRQPWKTGAPADHFLVLLGGSVDHDAAGRAFSTHAMATLGLYDVLAGNVRTEAVTAREPVHALRVDREPFFDMLEDHFEMTLDLLGHLARLLLSSAG